MTGESGAYEPSPKRPDEEMTGYTLRVMREEIRHRTLQEAAAALRSIAANRPPHPWSANESLAWKEAATYVEDMIASGDEATS